LSASFLQEASAICKLTKWVGGEEATSAEKSLQYVISLKLGVVGVVNGGCRFTMRMKSLTGRRGVAILYAYMFLGLGFLHAITPDFGVLSSKEQQLEGYFRYAVLSKSVA
jgi:ABC-type uncharacterized transport system fused permease/ATPase subunit